MAKSRSQLTQPLTPERWAAQLALLPYTERAAAFEIALFYLLGVVDTLLPEQAHAFIFGGEFALQVLFLQDVGLNQQGGGGVAEAVEQGRAVAPSVDKIGPAHQRTHQGGPLRDRLIRTRHGVPGGVGNERN